MSECNHSATWHCPVLLGHSRHHSSTTHKPDSRRSSSLSHLAANKWFWCLKSSFICSFLVLCEPQLPEFKNHEPPVVSLVGHRNIYLFICKWYGAPWWHGKSVIAQQQVNKAGMWKSGNKMQNLQCADNTGWATKQEKFDFFSIYLNLDMNSNDIVSKWGPQLLPCSLHAGRWVGSSTDAVRWMKLLLKMCFKSLKSWKSETNRYRHRVLVNMLIKEFQAENKQTQTFITYGTRRDN